MGLFDRGAFDWLLQREAGDEFAIITTGTAATATSSTATSPFCA